MRARGFTIVELLIVIVVIAILAAITIVAFNGIQQRGRNSQIKVGVKAYEKALKLYVADNGSFPTVSGCLGANYPSNACWTGPNGYYSVNATLDAALQQYIVQKPTVATKQLTITSVNDVRLGALYRYFSQTDARIIYYLEGPGQACLNGGGATEMEGTQCSLQLAQ